MSALKNKPVVRLGILLAGLGLADPAALTHATTFWTGPTLQFSHQADSSTMDKLTTNHVGAASVNNVWLTRGTSHPLYNAAAETSWNGSTSPVNTMWAAASGPLTSANTLHYDTFDNVVGEPGNSPGLSVGHTFYMHIVSDDIYLSVQLNAWGNNNGGSFTYTRSTPAVVVPPPTVSLTNPAAGAVFAAPASLKLGAVASGGVTNVQFFANAAPLGICSSVPFGLASAPLAAGAYSLSAVATAGGITATSAVVSVSIVSPAPVAASAPSVGGGQFSFSFSANAGLTYVVQSSSNLVNWVPVATNQAAGSAVPFSVSLEPDGPAFYRVGLMPNP